MALIIDLASSFVGILPCASYGFNPNTYDKINNWNKDLYYIYVGNNMDWSAE